MISAWNGFNFYKVLFGLSIAILISVTFEVARFACLFWYMHQDRRTGFLTIILYLITASVCAFASINSFTSEVIKRDRLNEKTYQEQIYKIRQSFGKKAAERVAAFNKDITYLQNMVAKYPGRKYWQRRLSQIVSNQDKFITERDRFLNTNPKSPEQWIRVQSALLGLELKESQESSEEIISVTQALRELWGLDKVTAQKIMGIVVTLTVELSILLLAILATTKEKPMIAAPNESLAHNDLLSSLQAKFGESKVRSFLAFSKNHFNKIGKLPANSHLNRNLRPIKRFIENQALDGLRSLFEK